MYKWHKVRVLSGEGVSVKGIAGRLKISKNTVRKYLRGSSPPEFKERGYDKKLDRFEEEVLEMYHKRYIGTRIYEELVGIGYDGSLATVHRHLRSLKREGERNSLSTVNGFHIRSMTKNELDPIVGTEISNPVPAEHTFNCNN